MAEVEVDRRSLPLQIRHGGEIVPDGLSMTITESYRLHVTYQYRLSGKAIVRVHLATPKETAADPTTWTAEEVENG